MRITPRREEIDAVRNILEDPTFESDEQMARALIKEMGEVYQMRNTFALVHRWADGSRGLNYGPFGSEAEALTFGGRLGGIGGRVGVVKLYAPGVLIANQDGKKGWKGYCQHPECGHAPFAHSFVGSRRGACQLITCPCDGWQAEKRKT